MNFLSRFILVLALLAPAATAGAKGGHEETVFLFQNRRVSVVVPDGLGFSSAKDERGMLAVRIADPKDRLSLQITFLPDAEGRFSTARARKEFMNETFQVFLVGSVEKAMQFEELDPKTGAGTYCVFTDAALVGKQKLPPGDYLYSTAGLKAWPGVVAVFSMLSNETDSKEYRAIMTMLRQSVQEKPVSPLL